MQSGRETKIDFTEEKNNKPSVRVEILARRQATEKVLEDIQVGTWGMANQWLVIPELADVFLRD